MNQNDNIVAHLWMIIKCGMHTGQARQLVWSLAIGAFTWRMCLLVAK